MFHLLLILTCILYKFYYPNYTCSKDIVKHYIQVFLSQQKIYLYLVQNYCTIILIESR
nr:MAG TPA: hypothetical protein [Caudoviricetes sp.]